MKKRLLSILLALMMIIGMIPLTTMTAFAAKEQFTTSVTGIEVTGDGYYFDPDTNNCHLDVDVSMISGTSKFYPDDCGFNSIYTNESCTTRLKTEPKPDETYYFNVYVRKANTTNNITNSDSNIKIDGFYNGKVLSTETTDDGFFYCVCSITYGELTGGVKAVASGVEYDSAEGGYAPNFTTLKAVSTEGKELEHTMVDGKYSYYGAKSGCLYKTNNGTSFSNMLTTEPQMGETYYSYFLLDSIDGNLNIEEELVDIQIPGYDVEYIASYERDMGFTSLVVYSVTKSKVYVGGVGMYNGDYLAVGATKTQTTKPSGGYAYYNNGKLTLNNYSYEGEGYSYVDNGIARSAIIYASNDIQIELVGTNNLTQKDHFNTACINGEANVSLTGAGTLNLQNAVCGIKCKSDLSIESGSLNIDNCELGFYSFGRKVIINGGNFEVNALDCAVNGYGGIEINGGSGIFRNTQDSVYNVLHAGYGSGPVTIDPSLVVMASTSYGALGEYVAADLALYKKIVIKYEDGWQQIDGKWYYYVSGVAQTGWLKDGTKWYYMDANGAMLTGWQKVDGKWYYLNNNMKTGWQQIGGKWYYLGTNGAMTTGWQKVSGKWYYMNANGVMQTGWQKISGKWYYLNSEMKTGWQKISGKWYYLNNEMKTGWVSVGGKWYYLGTDGAMRTGWVQLSGKWYYLNSSGVMVTGTQVIDGKTYKFNSSGVWIA